MGATESGERRRGPRWDGTTFWFLLVGLVPIVGLVLVGSWPRWEVGAGAAIVLLAGHQLLRGP